MSNSIYNLPTYTARPGDHEHTATAAEEQRGAAQNAPAADRFLGAPRRAWTSLSNSVNPPPGYRRHPELRKKAAKKGMLIGAAIGAAGGPAATAGGMFGPGHQQFPKGYLAGKGLGYIFVGTFFAGAAVGAVVGYTVGYALGGVVDTTLEAADHVQHAAHELADHFHGPRQPEAAHLA